MKRVFVFCALLLLAGSAFCQGMGQRRMFYDTSTVDTLTGRMGNFQLIQLMVKDTASTIRVNVGPGAYLEQQHITFADGDTVQVIGSKMRFNGNDFIMAAKIVDGGKSLTLRDKSGRPLWSRGVRR